MLKVPNKRTLSRGQFEANLAEKLEDPDFIADTIPLLAPDAAPFNVQEAAKEVGAALIELFPGDPWKGKSDKQ